MIEAQPDASRRNTFRKSSATARHGRSLLTRTTLLAAASALVIAVLSPARASDDPLAHNPTLAERAWVAASVYRTVKQYFAHWAGLPASYDFDARFKAYLPEALNAPDRRSFSLATMRLVASLANGHTNFTDEALYADHRPAPFYAEPIEGRWTVTVTRRSDIPLGSVITAIDDVPVDRWVSPIRAVIGQSSPRARDHLVFLRRFMFPEHFVVMLDGGRRIGVNKADPLTTRQGRASPESVTVQRRRDGVLVIAIPSFDEPRFEAAAISAIRAAKDVRLVVLDVRGNGGGTTPGALGAAIMTRPYAGTLVLTPLTIAENDAHGSFSEGDNPAPNAMLRYGPDVGEPQAGAYAGPMALLIDRACASACEDLAIRFQSGRRGPVLGEPSWGSTGQPIRVQFPELGMSLRVSTKRESFADGRPFEGVGVQPDLPVQTTRGDVTAGTDTVLERAIQLALAQPPHP